MADGQAVGRALRGAPRPDAVVEGEPLAAGVGNCVARPGGPQQLLVLRMPLSSLTPSGSTSATATKTPLGILPPAPMGCFGAQFGKIHVLPIRGTLVL